MSEFPPEPRTIIGIEVHVQLRTATKMFCGCPVSCGAAPNTCVCPVCLGYPGSLPVINRQAFEYALLTALALNCEIVRFTKWDRKSYYYPDLPKNYQISQYDLPLAREGHFDIPASGGMKRVRIRRAHLEEDAGKSLQDAPGCTLIDLNRAGTPLLEIVTEPDLVSADETFTFCTELQRLVTYLGVSEGNMQRGQMRFEPNVNVAIDFEGHEYGTPVVEIKNLNSFRAVRDAINYESKRQAEVWRQDHEYRQGIQHNENRGWNAASGITEYQRGKEETHDYRYFPDPDLVPLETSDDMLSEIRAKLPELPIARRQRFAAQYGMSAGDAETIVAHRATADLFEKVVAAGGPANIVSKHLTNIWLRFSNDCNIPLPELGIKAEHMADLAKITADGTVSRTAAKQVAEAMLDRATPPRPPHTHPPPPEPRALARADARMSTPSPRQIAEELGLIQVQDSTTIVAWVEEAFALNEQAVRDALRNPKKSKAALGFLRGQVMKISRGKADPRLAATLVAERIAHMRPSP